MGFLFILFGAAFTFGGAWIIQFFTIDLLIESKIVANLSEFWTCIRIFYVCIIIPPLYLLLFRTLPSNFQDDVIESARNVSLAVLYIGDWLGKGILLAFGAYLFSISF